MTGLLRACLVTGLVVLIVVPTPTPTSATTENPACSQIDPDLRVAPAQEIARRVGVEPGSGITVVVVAGSGRTEPHSISGAIAPGARIEDAPFHDAVSGSTVESTALTLAARLSGLADRRQEGSLPGRVVVLVPAQVPHSEALAAAVARLVAGGVLMVAASGDRPADDGAPDGFAERRVGEDAADAVWPAAADGVLSVGVSTPEAREAVLRNSGIDLAATGAGMWSLDGGQCVMEAISSHWAAAQVAGVAALVWSVHAAAEAAEVRARLLHTASGNGAPVSPLVGYGEVQAVEALQRRVEETASPAPEVGVRAQRPEARADGHATTAAARDRIRWWGLGGVAALVVLTLLRPLLSRRTTPNGAGPRSDAVGFCWRR